VSRTETPAAPPAADRILDAADRLLARYGYRKMTVDDLAKEAGIGKGTVYLSFESKADVALACIDRMVARLIERLEGLVTSPGDAGQRLEAMLVERVMHRFDYARPHSASLDELLASIRRPLLERRRGYFRAEARVFATVLEQGAAAGRFAADAAAAAPAFITATNSLLPYSLSVDELGRRDDILRRAEAVARLIVRGITATAKPSPRAARTRPSRVPRTSLSRAARIPKRSSR